MSRVSLLFLILFVANCGFRRGDRVLIPAGFVGLARIEYEVSGAPVLPMENGRHVVQLDPKGRASTSTKREVGYASDEYYYVEAAGKLRALQEEGVADSAKDMIHSHRYVHDKPFVHEFCVGLRGAGCGTSSIPSTQLATQLVPTQEGDRCQEIGVKEIGVKDPVTPNLIAHNHNSLMLQQVTTSQGSSARGGDIRTPYLQPTHLKPPIGSRSPQKAPSLAPASWPEVPGGSGRNRTLNLVSSSST